MQLDDHITAAPGASPSATDGLRDNANGTQIEITAITPRLVSIPLKDPVHMSGETVAKAENLVVEITDSNGISGWGEAASAPMMTGETPLGLLDAARHMARKLSGAQLALTDIDTATEPLIHHNHGAKAAVRLALLDLIGRKTKPPLYELLGGKRRERVAALVILGSRAGSEPDQAKRLVDTGVRALKVKIGLTNVANDLARSRAVRDAVGPDITISADANMAYSRDQAIEFMSGAKDAGLDFVEQPVDSDDLDAMAACAAVSAVPLCIDEALHGIADIQRYHDAGAAQGGNLKLIKTGGPFGLMAAARLLDELDMSVNIAGKIAETSIAGAATVHLSQAVPRLDWDASITNQYLVDDVTPTPMVMIDGHFSAPDGPGIGIEVDRAKLDKYTVDT